MDLRLKIKPQYFKDRTKGELMSKIRGYGRYGYSVGSRKGNEYVGLTAINGKFLRVYNIQKRRRKTKHDKYKNTIVIHPTYWEGFVYDIPFDVIDCMGLNIKQQRRNFKIYNK